MKNNIENIDKKSVNEKHVRFSCIIFVLLMKYVVIFSVDKFSNKLLFLFNFFSLKIITCFVDSVFDFT